MIGYAGRQSERAWRRKKGAGAWRRGYVFNFSPNQVNMIDHPRLRGLEERLCTPSNID
jgi:hypothetical protein